VAASWLEWLGLGFLVAVIVGWVEAAGWKLRQDDEKNRWN
jgi:hypothetical protein